MLSDSELITRIQSGDMRAFDKLLNRYRTAVFGFIYHMVPNRSEAEDMFQDTFMKVINGLKNYRHEEKFKSWVIRIANNAVIDRLRKEKRHAAVSLEAPAYAAEGGSPTELKDTLPDTDYAPDVLYEKKELTRDLEQAISSLPPDQKQVFLMREKAGLSFKEIAAELGCSINTALGRMHYAMKHLRKSLAPYYGG